MTPPPHQEHAAEELCEAGLELYSRAVREGHVPVREAEAVPCLLDAELLRPDTDDADRLRPTAPAVALPRLLRSVDEDIAHRRRQGVRLTEAFEPLLALAAPGTGPADPAGIRLLSGLDRINVAISEAVEDLTGEVLTIQPHNIGDLSVVPLALERDQALLDRGGRIRTLYQHTERYRPRAMARYEQLHGDVEARTLDELTERLLVIDRRVAFIPANKDRTLALEVRHPALVDYFATTFDRLWNLATPMYPEAVRKPSLNGITPRQRAIAALLVEGHTDTAIADRLGMNVRTARVHIAKLAATLGSESRAQLGFLIGESGILRQEDEEGEVAAD
ncbi:DNA-binding CsgD family transcriptional regulator/sugar-specific transcriptional regulator TrmB [Streptomyces griseochromogenes]|uniref:DNA-binding CsgD family transcriptional regulator/sugar-specific transcriptional regulator TrmB n=1 Tax=Streptomyces griseochromogenes TaxID=68214 RepID=A0A1B1APM7_9ACTN|nr:helix-turn-helix transcriptional regulator [Streptomyces griseochromogenes]ANP48470.1 helix-turn-helix transcriptional regulator [Streptomyces griseochromogenes]MBP2052860.1 DNA-binding CsgD family transcriptional regulator/sugar-specific transcriptional regulator TrmB [Streptomyces griseochromogenes]